MPKPTPAADWPWPFDEVDLRQPDGSYVRLQRGDAIPTPDPAVDEPASTPEETQP